MKFLFLLLLPVVAFAKVKTEKFTYEKDGVKMIGTLAYDDKFKKPLPAVVIFPDWMGVGEYTEMRAKQIAEMGYVALAADIYGDDKRAADVKEAMSLAGKYRDGDRAEMRKRVNGAVEAFAKDKRVNKDKMVAIGYCFGGTAALELARSGAPIKGVISFHGGLNTKVPATEMKARVLALHGADDPFVPAQEVMDFQEEMRKAKADWTMVSYGNAVHSFTLKDAGSDNSKGAAYNEKADQRSFEEMKRFFKETL